MQYDLLKKVVAELSGVLPHARVGKVYQPAADIIILRLRAGQENLRLLISVNPAHCRIHLTATSWPNPASPPRFCQLLRARLARILAVQLLNEDRILALRCAGPQGETVLIVELTGRSSNMVLLDAAGLIIDALHRVDEKGSGRMILPGQRYAPPVHNQSAVPEPEILRAASAGESVNENVDKYYATGQGADNKTDLRALITQAMVKKRQKLKRRLNSIASEVQRQAQAEQFKQSGELLLANLQLLRRGMEAVEVLNYYLQPPVMSKILLAARRSPTENAEDYFKLYKKAKRGQAHSQRRLLETQDELDWLDSIEYALHEAVSAVAIEEIAAECRQTGLLSSAQDRYVKKSVNLKTVPLEAISPSGYQVLWGRNNQQNDYLSTKLLKPADLWFHARQCPGAHVVLRGVGPYVVVPEIDVLFAAALAAGYSRAREDSKVEVMIAEPKQVIKPKGAKPGLVSVRHYKTVLVKPLRID